MVFALVGIEVQGSSFDLIAAFSKACRFAQATRDCCNLRSQRHQHKTIASVSKRNQYSALRISIDFSYLLAVDNRLNNLEPNNYRCYAAKASPPSSSDNPTRMYELG